MRVMMTNDASQDRDAPAGTGGHSQFERHHHMLFGTTHEASLRVAPDATSGYRADYGGARSYRGCSHERET